MTLDADVTREIMSKMVIFERLCPERMDIDVTWVPSFTQVRDASGGTVRDNISYKCSYSGTGDCSSCIELKKYKSSSE